MEHARFLFGIVLLIATTSGCVTNSPPRAVSFTWAAAQTESEILKAGATTQPIFKATLASSQDPIYFAELMSDSDLMQPLIFRKIKGKWAALNVGNDWSGDAWFYAAAGPGPAEIWGILDHAEEDTAQDLVLIHSTDGGETWIATALSKDCYFATFSRFSMDATGRGIVTIYLDSDYTDTVKAGYYRYRTSDGGKTWSAPEFEGDATTAAEHL